MSHAQRILSAIKAGDAKTTERIVNRVMAEQASQRIRQTQQDVAEELLNTRQ